ncbi:hypothetical protein KP004_04620 [Geomonas oryzisoli]|uniref:Uncharacterized protein n=1 Tax=Geomonas oryzisoli TaxID=2847992 RepID=A0ABX8J802_9BACT|nr:hypothetical protein [Geomonas oryzisoli]QWV94475.1 hypothetical protein KP004_04620 [Geomonas oryzisoli]
MNPLRVKGVIAAALLALALAQPARAEQAWQATFDETCSKSNQAMTMSVQELRDLLATCDALQKVIETQEESVRKVYLKRLSLCRNLYAYMLEFKQSNQGK